MKIVTSQQMRELDRAAIEKHKIPSLDLMERAGKGLAHAVVERIQNYFLPFVRGGLGWGRSTSPGPSLQRRGKDEIISIIIFCGRGNNGGDGLVAARHLIEGGRKITVIIFAQKEELSLDARANYDCLASTDVKIVHILKESELSAMSKEINSASCIIDALLGTGLEREVTGLLASAIKIINSVKCPVIAADIPSGLNADTGMPMGISVRAVMTITFGFPKLGLFIAQGPDYAGKVEVIDIGIPKEEIAAIDSKTELIEPEMFAAHFSKRLRTSHKGDYGHVAIFAGSGGHLGAGFLAALAALRAGSGLVTYCLPNAAFEKFDARYPEIMCDPLPDGSRSFFTLDGLARAIEIVDRVDVIAIGPAIGTNTETRAFVNSFIADAKVPVVVDADGLNVLGIDAVKKRKAATILTPHPGEMARIMGIKISDVQADRLACASKLALDSNSIVVLKGAATIVAAPDGMCAINPTGNPGMASAGMGDALTGIIASFLAQKMDAKTAAIAAVYLHGLAGDIAAEEIGETSVIATDVIERLGRAIGTLVL